MGVKGLQYYAEKESKAICHEISIPDLAAHYQTTGSRVLVVDGMSLLNRVCPKGNDWMYGGQWREYCAKMQSFVKRFKDGGIELVFFYDGSVVKTKRMEWVSRRKRKLVEIIDLFQFVKSTRQHPPESMFHLPTSMGSLSRFLVKYECNCEVFTSIEEADQEISTYALRNRNCFAILGQDSDYLIYDTKPYLSITHLDIDNLRTVMYDRNQLAREIGIDASLLPVFSCMVGNDVIPSQMLRPFHRYLCNTPYRNPSITDLLPKIGDLIRSYKWTGREIRHIAMVMKIDENLLKDALYVYSCHIDIGAGPLPKGAIGIARSMAVNAEGSNVIYTLLCRQEYESSEVLEDKSDTTMFPSAIIYRLIRRRMYALLFHFKTVPVMEWCAYHDNPMENPEVIVPSQLDYKGCIPSLVDLWSHKPEVMQQQWELFKACLGIKISVDEMQRIPHTFRTICCLLNFLILNRELTNITNWEVIAFLCQAISPLANDLRTIARVQIAYVEPRAVQLASLFMRGVTQVNNVLIACGQPFCHYYTMPWLFFDGKLFHHYYILAKNGASLERMCENQSDTLDQLHNLHMATTMGTAFSQTPI